MSELHIKLAPWANYNPSNNVISDEFANLEMEYGWESLQDILNPLSESDISISVEPLCKSGLAYLVLANSDLVHYTELAAMLIRNIRVRSSTPELRQFHDQLCSGKLDPRIVQIWLRAMFAFTKSAGFHIGIMKKYARRRGEHFQKWDQFYSEEIHHWKIYRSIFNECGIDINEERRRPLAGVARRFIRHPVLGACLSEQHYAALLYVIETGPTGETIEQDPIFRSLYQHYNFSFRAANFLFNHTLANTQSNHSALWWETIASKTVYPRDEAMSIVVHAVEHINIMQAWQNEIQS